MLEQQQMRAALADWVNLNGDQWSQLVIIFQSRVAKARQDILLPHTSVHEIYFVSNGLLRFYYLSDEQDFSAIYGFWQSRSQNQNFDKT